MRFVEVSAYAEKPFYRLTVVTRNVFEHMVEVVASNLKGLGRPRKLSVEDMVLMTLDYWREYRTQFHVVVQFWRERSHRFAHGARRRSRAVAGCALSLAGEKALHNGSLNLDVVVVDASEQRVERPQKTKAILLGQGKVSHPERTTRD